MARFDTIAIPHDDIQQGRFTLDVYAANLWEVFTKNPSCPEEYKDSDEFFKKTYITNELKYLIIAIEKRLKGQGGDSVIQLQTPFGGGKTHTLIALYHKAVEWKANRVVIVGEDIKSGGSFDKFDTLWGLLEQQLTGTVKEFEGQIPPGGDQIKRLLEKYCPVLILLDELIPYLNKADAIDIGRGKSLTSVTLTFIETLTNVVSSLPDASLVFTTTPSNPFDRTPRGLEIVQDLQNITARKDAPKSPVQDDEVSFIIRRRLFKQIDESKAQRVIDEFIDYAEKNSILPPDIPPTEYRKRFHASYPFLPEVIDVLYHRWGSFHNFQRTRGVLRLLALVVKSVIAKNLPYISVADFDLTVQDIRRELIKHIDPQFETIVAKDITSAESGANKLNMKVSDSYKGLKLGTRTASAIFMYSFTGGVDKGMTLGEAKRMAATFDCPATLISDVLEESKNVMFYLKHTGTKYVFTTEPTLYSIVNVKMDNIKGPRVAELQEKLFRDNLGSNKLKTYYLPKTNSDVPETPEFKLVIFSERSETKIKEFIEKKGITPRVNRNTIFSFVPIENEKSRFENNLKKFLAYEEISKDNTLNLSLSQQAEVQTELRKLRTSLKDDLRNLYRFVLIPDKSGFKELDLGIPTFGDTKRIDEEIYEKLRANGDILSKIAPIVIKEKYLNNRQYAQIQPIYNASLTTQGETRFADETVLFDSIKQGVSLGVFGVGVLLDDKPVCKWFEESIPELTYGDEYIIEASVCRSQKEEERKMRIEMGPEGSQPPITPTTDNGGIQEPPLGGGTPSKFKQTVNIDLTIPKGRTSNLVGLLNLLQHHYQDVSISIKAKNGQMTEQDYEDKIMETLRQMGVD
jgi:guanylate kinase